MKIVQLASIGACLDSLRAAGKRIVHCHGCFDLLHLGHVRYFRAAKSLGDILVVTLTADTFIQKGPGRPVFNEDMRAEFIAELECVDFVSIVPFPTAAEAISHIRPDVFAKGGDFKEWNEALRLEKEAVESHGGRMYFTEEYRYVPMDAKMEVVAFHSSDLIESFPRK